MKPNFIALSLVLMLTLGACNEKEKNDVTPDIPKSEVTIDTITGRPYTPSLSADNSLPLLQVSPRVNWVNKEEQTIELKPQNYSECVISSVGYCTKSDNKIVDEKNYYRLGSFGKSHKMQWDGYYPKDQLIKEKPDFIESIEFGDIEGLKNTVVGIGTTWFKIWREGDKVFVSMDKNTTENDRLIIFGISSIEHGLMPYYLTLTQTATAEEVDPSDDLIIWWR